MKNIRRGSDFMLDNTLRLLYASIRYHGGSLVAIRFKHRGTEYAVDTPEEALSLRRKLEEEDQEEVQQGIISHEQLVYETTRWSEDRFLALTQNIGIAQQKFLGVLIASPRGPVSVETIARRLGLANSTALGGIQSGLAKQLRTMDMDTRDLYRVEISWPEGERKRFLTLNEGFRLAAIDNRWPPDYVMKTLKK